jgi:hypothetical protein
MNNISQAISRLFEKHRIVFWYDVRRELRGEFEALLLPGINIVELAINDFAVKHLLREQPTKKFLICQESPQPANDPDNWQLDVQLV